MPIVKKRPTYEEIEQYFFEPLSVAAEKLGIGRTLLKQICRQHNIQRFFF
jgi:hypothetical protein